MTESHSPQEPRPTGEPEVADAAMPASLPDPEMFSAPHEHDRMAAIEKRLAALEDLAIATAEALASEERPHVGSALRNLRKQGRG